MDKRPHSSIHSNSNKSATFYKFEANESKKEYTRGLEINIGGNCYMNATLQCLVNIKELTNYFLGNKNNIDKNKNKLSNAFLELIENLWKNNNKPFNPKNLKDLIGKMNPLILNHQKRDIKDLILFFLETLHNELNKAKINTQNFNNIIYQDDFDKYRENYSSYFINNFQSIISDVFYGLYYSQIICNI